MMRTMRTGLAGTFAAIALLGYTPQNADAQRRDRDLITRDELVQSSQKNADLYQAVRSLRSHFVQGSRGPRSLGLNPPPRGGQGEGSAQDREAVKTILYINGVRSGDIEMMRNINTINVEEVRYLNPNSASMQYGTGHEGGAVLVKLTGPPDGGA